MVTYLFLGLYSPGEYPCVLAEVVRSVHYCTCRERQGRLGEEVAESWCPVMRKQHVTRREIGIFKRTYQKNASARLIVANPPASMRHLTNGIVPVTTDEMHQKFCSRI